MREMILSDSTENREKALAKILPYQKQDFYGILKAMEGLPVTIRTLDPPLHEFLPQDAESIRKVASIMNVSPEKITAKVKSLHEINPMLGHRGCRLGIAYPEITAMQARAIFEAACELTKEGYKVYPEVMIPLISTLNELRLQKSIVIDEAIKAMSKYGVEIEYLVGTMIEIPRACLTADEIAGEAQFFSFGTNDLTQMTFGFSRDDIGSFLPQYLEQKILPCDPFARIDETGVGKLVQMGVEKGRMINEKLKIGVCGEHGGEPNSVRFFYRTGLNYVSCSPRRVPVAILTAAQEGLKRKLGK
jgi:pyruvate,orthophosphate dikinase